MQAVAQWLASNLFGVPAFLLLLIVLIGHLLQKSPVEKTITGTLKAIRNYPEFPERSNYMNLRWSEFTLVAVLGDATCAGEEKGRVLIENAASEISGIIIKERTY